MIQQFEEGKIGKRKSKIGNRAEKLLPPGAKKTIFPTILFKTGESSWDTRPEKTKQNPLPSSNCRKKVPLAPEYNYISKESRFIYPTNLTNQPYLAACVS